MPITNHDQQDLKQFYVDYKEKYGGKKEDYFALLYLTKKFKCNVSDIVHQVAFGNYDFGIDAYYIDRKAQNLYLYQFKWSEDHNLFKESFQRLLDKGLTAIFSNDSIDPNENEYLKYFKADFRECQSIIKRVYFHMVFKGDLEKAENSKGLDYLVENIRDKTHVIENALGCRHIDLFVEFVSDNTRRPSRPIVLDTFKIRFKSASSIQSQDGTKSLHVGYMPLMDLYRIYLALGQRLLDRNIRSVLDPKNPPNKKIKDTLSRMILRGEESCELFPFYHNGITLAAEKLDFGDNIAEIRVPRLLNGAQTVASFEQFIETNKDNAAMTQNMEALDQINVLTKIVITDLFSDFVTAVTISNNQQNPVEPWNLRANDKIQCDLQDKFYEQAKISYSRQEKAFEKLSIEEREELKESRRAILIKPLCQTFSAVQGEIGRMSHLGDVFEIEKQYRDCFKEKYLSADVRRIILAYKVHLVLNSPIRRLENTPTKWLSEIIRPAKNLIWALLIQGLFNDKKIDVWLELYTENLIKNQDLGDDLSTIASTKLVPLLKAVLGTDSNRRKIKEEKYSFLRNKELYKQCMNEAFNKYGWSRLSL